MHLVDEYRPGSGFFFGTNTKSLLANGRAVVLPGRGGLAAARAETVLKALGNDQILVGAVPFDEDSPAHLVVPDHYRWGAALPPADSPMPVATRGAICTPSHEHYRRAVTAALETIDTTELAKVVLARSVTIPLEEPIHVPQALRQLRQRQNGYVFGCELPTGASLIGGTPELLVSRVGETAIAHPLAGSRPRSGDKAIDEQRSKELLASAKDRHEHAMVVDDIARRLMPYCTSLDAPREPTIVTTPHMLHLGTRITGKLASAQPSALSLAAALHPTPAVCGTPTDSARSTIKHLEGFDREFYAGMVGWCDAAGNGEWAVTIRCAQLFDDQARLYAGAGIVAGSSPQAELAETQAKLETMLSALGYRLEEEHDGLHAVA